MSLKKLISIDSIKFLFDPYEGVGASFFERMSPLLYFDERYIDVLHVNKDIEASLSENAATNLNELRTNNDYSEVIKKRFILKETFLNFVADFDQSIEKIDSRRGAINDSF